tara:strand:+ start:234 stop:545 length:312 start_codon:yes stop_codon:yes gene_type:complete
MNNVQQPNNGELKLYLLNYTDLYKNRKNKPVFDILISTVIAAKDEETARQIIVNSYSTGGESRTKHGGIDNLWLDSKYSSCKIIGNALNTIRPGIICVHFNNG